MQLVQAFAGVGVEIPQGMVQVEKDVFVFHKPFVKIAGRFAGCKITSI
jgi:hypothetical protein